MVEGVAGFVWGKQEGILEPGGPNVADRGCTLTGNGLHLNAKGGILWMISA